MGSQLSHSQIFVSVTLKLEKQITSSLDPGSLVRGLCAFPSPSLFHRGAAPCNLCSSDQKTGGTKKVKVCFHIHLCLRWLLWQWLSLPPGPSFHQVSWSSGPSNRPSSLCPSRPAVFVASCCCQFLGLPPQLPLDFPAMLTRVQPIPCIKYACVLNTLYCLLFSWFDLDCYDRQGIGKGKFGCMIQIFHVN